MKPCRLIFDLASPTFSHSLLIAQNPFFSLGFLQSRGLWFKKSIRFR